MPIGSLGTAGFFGLNFRIQNIPPEFVDLLRQEYLAQTNVTALCRDGKLPWVKGTWYNGDRHTTGGPPVVWRKRSPVSLYDLLS